MSAPGRRRARSSGRGSGCREAPVVQVLPRALSQVRSLSESHGPYVGRGDSLTVAAWTILSRVTGLARVAVVGAVLGPTYTGNTYQFTNSLPNLLYYGFLAGGLFSSLLAPALVRHIDAGDGEPRNAGGWWLPGRDAGSHGGDHAAGDHPRTAGAESRGPRRAARGRRRRGPRRAPT